ncbi:prohormone-1-like [Uloborus diversus]|uniref:prohormone-1-like n=1 Tax=Uloborus diversus TaxID=327109 RepID=UPI0024099064|nr:prohormone-1-like [Uloborus diversus]
MVPCVKSAAILLLSGILIFGMMAKVNAKVLGSADKALYANDMEVGGDGDTPVDNAVLNYLFARQMNRMRNRGGDYAAELLRKRSSYWKQCAFNAVSCFG